MAQEKTLSIFCSILNAQRFDQEKRKSFAETKQRRKPSISFHHPMLSFLLVHSALSLQWQNVDSKRIIMIRLFRSPSNFFLVPCQTTVDRREKSAFGSHAPFFVFVYFIYSSIERTKEWYGTFVYVSIH